MPGSESQEFRFSVTPPRTKYPEGNPSFPERNRQLEELARIDNLIEQVDRTTGEKKKEAAIRSAEKILGGSQASETLFKL